MSTTIFWSAHQDHSGCSNVAGRLCSTKKCEIHASAYGTTSAGVIHHHRCIARAAISSAHPVSVPARCTARVPGWLCARTYSGQKLAKLGSVVMAEENGKLKMVKQQNLPALPLLGANGFDVLAANAKFDAERWAQIRALHDRASYDGARSRKSRGLGRIENRVITRIADHRMLGSVEAVVVSQLGEIGDVLELAIAERRVRRKRPVAAGSRSGAAREPHQNAGHVFAAEAVEN